MLKKLLLIFAVLFTPLATLAPTLLHAGQMVNVKYIHKLIERDWKIKIAYNPKLENPKVAANMKYLLTTIDVANEILNGAKTTNYGNDERYATKLAADTIATNKAVATLIKIKPKFKITTTADTEYFEFKISAKGTFYVDWGDGKYEIIDRDNTTSTTYSHDYASTKTGGYTIGFTGQATGYADGGAAISFSDNFNISDIDGSLGAIFSTIGDGSGAGQQPRFTNTFYRNVNLTGSIPPDLFSGVRGVPVSNMFYGTFSRCWDLSGSIPVGLFSGLQGAPGDAAFAYTFNGCGKLSGEIPENLFSGLRGQPGSSVFNHTFESCSGLFGNIPANLFAGLSGSMTSYLFSCTFAGCSGLTGSIPPNLFAGIKGADMYAFRYVFDGCSGLTGKIPDTLFDGVNAIPYGMFIYAFRNCTGLSGESAKIGGKYLYEIWPDATESQVGGCYSGATGLADYADIPDNWK